MIAGRAEEPPPQGIRDWPRAHYRRALPARTTGGPTAAVCGVRWICLANQAARSDSTCRPAAAAARSQRVEAAGGPERAEARAWARALGPARGDRDRGECAPARGEWRGCLPLWPGCCPLGPGPVGPGPRGLPWRGSDTARTYSPKGKAPDRCRPGGRCLRSNRSPARTGYLLRRAILRLQPVCSRRARKRGKEVRRERPMSRAGWAAKPRRAPRSRASLMNVGGVPCELSAT